MSKHRHRGREKSPAKIDLTELEPRQLEAAPIEPTPPTPIDLTPPVAKRRAPALPLGRAFWRLQAALLISSLADACIFIAPIYWIIVEQGLDLSEGDAIAGVRDQILLVMTWVPMVRLISLPLLAPFGDALHRGRVLSVALLLRAAPWIALAMLSANNPLSLRSLIALGLGAALSGLVDTTSLALVPRLVPPSEVERALSLSAGLPRAGFFLSVMIGLLVVVLLGVRTTLFVGAGLLAIAAVVCGRFEEHGAPPPEGRAAWSPLGALGAGRAVLLLAVALGLTNFAVYPLYWVGPSVASLGAVDPDHLEIAVAAGSILGVLSLGLLSRLRPAHAIGGSLIVLGVALAELCDGRTTLYAGVTVGAAFGASNLLLVARAITLAPDPLRARVAALCAALFAVGGELGLRFVQPVLAEPGPPWITLALGIPVAIFGVLIARADRLLAPDLAISPSQNK